VDQLLDLCRRTVAQGGVEPPAVVEALEVDDYIPDQLLAGVRAVAVDHPVLESREEALDSGVVVAGSRPPNALAEAVRA
jgi:hypothetical protein